MKQDPVTTLHKLDQPWDLCLSDGPEITDNGVFVADFLVLQQKKKE